MCSSDLNALGLSYRERQSVEPALPVQPARNSSGAFSIACVDAAGHMRKLEEVEAELIRMAIARYDGRMSEVARRLGIGRSTLYRKLKDLGLDDGVDAPPPEDAPRVVNE